VKWHIEGNHFEGEIDTAFRGCSPYKCQIDFFERAARKRLESAHKLHADVKWVRDNGGVLNLEREGDSRISREWIVGSAEPVTSAYLNEIEVILDDKSISLNDLYSIDKTEGNGDRRSNYLFFFISPKHMTANNDYNRGHSETQDHDRNDPISRGGVLNARFGRDKDRERYEFGDFIEKESGIKKKKRSRKLQSPTHNGSGQKTGFVTQE